MKKLLLFILSVLPLAGLAQRFTPQEVAHYERQAKQVTIIRDKWGVPHIYGQTDANVVFGLMYSQCEENFKGIERNYLYQIGRQAEADGATNLYTDVQLQMIADTADAIKDYQKSAPWFRKLLDAFADGINYYIYKHPQFKPQVFKRYEPWFALMFTDGSVSATVTGGLTLNETARFYGGDAPTGAITLHRTIDEVLNEQAIGSNGFAVAPKLTVGKHAMLYINPHVPFYFRSEVQLVSNEGLNVYGAVTWGQFFVYQGFNQHCGWMHTSSNADVGDLYAERVTRKDNKWYYEYNGEIRPVTERKLVFNVKDGDKITQKTITGYYTHHGPVLGSRGGKWLALKADNRSYEALLESWLITKANTFAEYKKAMNLLNNATNNTVYADDKGNIAFWYGNFMPRRDPTLDWTQPVDGSVKATEWKGLHSLDEIVHVYNPATGWIQNCNSTPYTSSGKSSPDKNRYPAYMAPDGQNYRALNAVKIFNETKGLTLDGLITRGYDKYLTSFDDLLPVLFKAYDEASDSARVRYAEPIDTLKKWDRRSAKTSIATSIAYEWGLRIMQLLPRAKSSEEGTYQVQRMRELLKNIDSKLVFNEFMLSLQNLKNNYGDWKVKWGDINRYQRPANGVFNDAGPSLPVGQGWSVFGQLPSFASRSINGTKKKYGYNGNSFVAAVEFGPKIKAKSIITGGQSFDPASKHYADQAQGYIDGKFKDVLFYKADVLKHSEKTYHPGEE